MCKLLVVNIFINIIYGAHPLTQYIKYETVRGSKNTILYLFPSMVFFIAAAIFKVVPSPVNTRVGNCINYIKEISIIFSILFVCSISLEFFSVRLLSGFDILPVNMRDTKIALCL